MNRGVDNLHEKVQNKGYVANRLVDGLKEMVMDENNTGYGVQRHRVTGEFLGARVNVDRYDLIGPIMQDYSKPEPFGQITLEIKKPKQPELPYDSFNSLFHKIVGLESQKELFRKVMRKQEETGECTHVLLSGSPAGAKSMFTDDIRAQFGEVTLFVDGNEATKEGIVDALFKNKNIKYVIIEELDKMSPRDQRGLLLLMSANMIAETKKINTRKMELKAIVFATANNLQEIPRELKSRFFIAKIRDYTFPEFSLITRHYCEGKLSDDLADYMADKVYNELNSKDFRDIVKLVGLCKDKSDVDLYTGLMKDE